MTFKALNALWLGCLRVSLSLYLPRHKDLLERFFPMCPTCGRCMLYGGERASILHYSFLVVSCLPLRSCAGTIIGFVWCQVKSCLYTQPFGEISYCFIWAVYVAFSADYWILWGVLIFRRFYCLCCIVILLTVIHPEIIWYSMDGGREVQSSCQVRTLFHLAQHDLY